MIRIITTVLTLAIAATVFSCGNSKSESNSLSPGEKKGEEILNKSIAAHGGMERWDSFEGLSYNLMNSGQSLYQITQLKDRRTYSKADSFSLGNDGKVAWSLPNAEKVPGKSAAFYYNLDFYFVAIPFVLKDKGVHTSYEGQTIIQDKAYETLKVTFGDAVGTSPEDVYFLYLDPETYLLRILTYSVSFFNKEAATINSAKVYSEYKDVQGILMPHKMQNYQWKDGLMGANTNHDRDFSDFKFIEKIADTKIFEVPAGAAIEQL